MTSRSAVLGGGTGLCLALVVSGGILVQRLLGATAANAVAANLVTTIVAVVAVLATVRTFLTSLDPAAFGRDARKRRIRGLVAGQVVGAVVGVLLVHAFVCTFDAWPWLHEHPRQLVNDLVAVFAILAFVWGCSQKPIRLEAMIGGLALVIGYELTAGYWHLDAPIPTTQHLVWSVQRFVGGEVTASGLGVLAFRMMFT
jgi:hypothetical protein